MARTKAQKLAAKRGRPRKEGYREPNGRPSRSGQAHEPADAVALLARARQFRLSRDHAKDPRAGTFLGRLNMLGRESGLSDSQYDAAQKYLEVHTRYQRSLQSPGAIYDPEAGGGASDDPEAYAKWVKGVSEKFTAARNAIQEAQFENRSENLWAALDYVILRGEAHAHLVGATRILCNALSRHFKIAGTHERTT